MHWDCCQTVHVGCWSWGKAQFEIKRGGAVLELFYKQQYLRDIHSIYLLNWYFWNVFFPYTKKWFIIVWQQENNFPIPRKRNNGTQEVFKLICKKMTIYFSGELQFRKKAPFLRSMHHSYMWSYTQWGCAMQYWRIWHLENY